MFGLTIWIYLSYIHLYLCMIYLFLCQHWAYHHTPYCPDHCWVPCLPVREARARHPDRHELIRRGFERGWWFERYMCTRFQIRCVFLFISIMPISSPNPMCDHLLESSHRDDSNKWSNKGFGEEITQVESILLTISGALALAHFCSGYWYSSTL